MRALRLLSAWILLAITALVVVPREQWHGLGHDEHLEAHADGAASVAASCVQCETGVPVALASAALVVPSLAFILCPTPALAVQGTDLGFTPLTADRGPPARC